MQTYRRHSNTRNETTTIHRRTSSVYLPDFRDARFLAAFRNAIPATRSGLAPLELTLSLPIMLFVMGLMIIVGTTASWKIRTVTNSRQAVWRTIDPRDGEEDPHSRGWPSAARMEIEEGSRDL